jgi:hypothetical protein
MCMGITLDEHLNRDTQIGTLPGFDRVGVVSMNCEYYSKNK